MTNTPNAPVVLTIVETAKILRVSRGFAYDAAKRGDIPTIRIGKRLLVPKAALDRMLSGEASRTQRA